MLHEFLKANRAELIARCRMKVQKRSPTGEEQAATEHGIPTFLEQLIETFRVEQTPEALARHKALGPGRPSLTLVPSDIAGAAAKHGGELRRLGLTIDQVVHGYGDLCQALTELAMEKNAPITVDEFHTFNRCLDDAIADAVTSFAGGAGEPVSSSDALPSEGTGPAEEMRHLLETAIYSFAAIKAGQVSVRGATAGVHEKSLIALQALIDRVFEEERSEARAPVKHGT